MMNYIEDIRKRDSGAENGLYTDYFVNDDDLFEGWNEWIREA